MYPCTSSISVVPSSNRRHTLYNPNHHKEHYTRNPTLLALQPPALNSPIPQTPHSAPMFHPRNLHTETRQTIHKPLWPNRLPISPNPRSLDSTSLRDREFLPRSSDLASEPEGMQVGRFDRRAWVHGGDIGDREVEFDEIAYFAAFDGLELGVVVEARGGVAVHLVEDAEAFIVEGFVDEWREAGS
jgi:hypothetical protein